MNRSALLIAAGFSICHAEERTPAKTSHRERFQDEPATPSVAGFEPVTFEVEFQFSPTMVTRPGGHERCLHLELFTQCDEMPVVIETTGISGGLFDLIPRVTFTLDLPLGATPRCITARDPQHTLRSCYHFQANDKDDDGVWHATIDQDPFFGGNWLLNGNLERLADREPVRRTRGDRHPRLC